MDVSYIFITNEWMALLSKTNNKSLNASRILPVVQLSTDVEIKCNFKRIVTSQAKRQRPIEMQVLLCVSRSRSPYPPAPYLAALHIFMPNNSNDLLLVPRMEKKLCRPFIFVQSKSLENVSCVYKVCRTHWLAIE